jgi:polar amino acid transport system permease protein
MSHTTDTGGGRHADLSTGDRRWNAGSAPSSITGLTTAAVAVSALIIAGGVRTLIDARLAAATLEIGGLAIDAVLVILGLALLLPLWPALQAVAAARRARNALAGGRTVDARTLTAEARDHAYYALGLSAAITIVILLAQFFIANNLAVSRTFVQLPLIGKSFWLIVKAFWTNIYIFLIAEVLVLVWGLLVAIARLVPGEAGRPVRAIATVYTDVFRGSPAIINIYLIGFGLPLTGLPFIKDLSQESFAILALTLTYGAYVAEVYRSGIESIHWSQAAAARSLGLTYFQTLRYAIVPQAVRRIIPPLLNDFIGLQKDTALVNVIGSIDAFNQAKIVASNNFNLSPVTTVTILFILITIPQTRFVDAMIERDQRRIRGGN